MRSLEFFTERLDSFLHELHSLVAIESPTGNLKQLNLAADFLEERLKPMGVVEREQLTDHGPLLRFRRGGSGLRVLLLGHLDTVWPVGSWIAPWKVENGRAYGPGVYDMKGGLLFILWMLRFFEAQGFSHPNLEVLINPDEEIGSPGSRSSIEEAARRADVVLVLEPTNLDGVLKLARKGSGEYVVTIHGRAAHQGVEPEKGINTVVEASHQVLRLLELEDTALGTTVGPNVIDGGTASNMVPDRTEIRVDVRAWSVAETERLSSALRGLSPVLEGTKIHVLGGWNRPPMEPNEESLDLFQGIQVLGQRLGMDLQWARWGGSSDANIAAAVGATTIDGFGPIGEGSHQMSENIVVDEVPKRLTLLTELIRSFEYLSDH